MAGIAVLFQIFQSLKHLQVRFHGHVLTALSAVGVQNTLDVAQTLASGHNAAVGQCVFDMQVVNVGVQLFPGAPRLLTALHIVGGVEHAAHLGERFVQVKATGGDITVDTSTIDESILSSGNVDGKQIAMPLSTSLVTVGYSPACLKAAGLEEPTSDWTWDDFANMCNTIYEKTGKLGTSTGPVDDTNMFNYWIRQHGEQLFADDNKSLGFEDDTLTANYFTMWKDMMDKGGAADPDEYEQLVTLGIEAGPIATDECGFHFNWNNFTSLMANVNPNLKMATPPTVEGGVSGLWMKPGMFFSVAETSQYKEECAAFIDWFINSEEANAIMKGERGTPVSSTAREYLVGSGMLNEQQKQMFDYVDIAAPLCGETPAPDPVGIAEVNQAFKDAAYSVFYGQVSAEEAAASFREQADSILATNN